jgi:hypothetical protein
MDNLENAFKKIIYYCKIKPIIELKYPFRFNLSNTKDKEKIKDILRNCIYISKKLKITFKIVINDIEININENTEMNKINYLFYKNLKLKSK